MCFSHYRVMNRDKLTILANDTEVASTTWSRMRGLIGRSAREFDSGKGMWIIPSQGIHTIGMSFPIDVAYLDCSGRVLRTYHRLVPFRVGVLSLKAKSILELPAGTLEESRTSIGDVLEFAGRRKVHQCIPDC